MIAYLIKSVVCASLLLLVYYLFLEKERIHTFKRFYLLTSVLLSIIIPFISLEASQTPSVIQEVLTQSSPVVDVPQKLIDTQLNEGGHKTWLFIIAYAIVALVLLIRFITNLLVIMRSTKGALPITIGKATIILAHKKTIPHTFFNYIFINVQDMKNNQILTHELTHSRQCHSIDIVFIEFIHCIFWFNPVLIFLKKAIRLNHEFLADEAVLKNYEVSEYQQLLLRTIDRLKPARLVSTFNYSITKKRFTMMTTLENQKRSMIRITATAITAMIIVILSVNISYSQSPRVDEYTIYKGGKWQNLKLTVNPMPVEGKEALMKSFRNVLTYPKSAKVERIEGEVAVMFEVNVEGKITACEVIKQLQQDCDAMVVSVLRTSGIAWKPAELDGKKYPSRFVLPVKFSIDDSQLEETFDRSSVLAKSLSTVYLVTYSASN